MRIRSVRIKNFRAFADETVLIDPYTCLVGANGAGKSTLLSALNIFFREASNSTPVDALSPEDFHQKNTADRVEISITFGDLSDEAKADLSDYVRNDELIVSAVAVFDEFKGKATVKQVGSRMALAEFAPFFEAYKANAPAPILNAIFDKLRLSCPGISDGKSKDAKRDALQLYEADPANASRLVPIESEDHFYGIGGQSKLKAHVQWVYVPAVKDASEEQEENKNGALGKLLARTVRSRVNFKEQLTEIEKEAQERYAILLGANQEALNEVANSLSARLGQWSHPDVDLRLTWNGTPISIREPTANVIAGEHGFVGDLARFGHGFQRSYLLALLQELAAIEGGDAPTLILGVEEPELYQHPPQARYLAQTLQSLGRNNAQVVVTTHSPYFIGGSNFENVRLVRKSNGKSTALAISHGRFAERYAEADEALPQRPSAIEAQLNEVLRSNINEMFFASKLVLVEGSEDVAYLMTWMALNDRLSDFRSQGVHVVAVEGKANIPSPLIIAQELCIPVLVIFDGDRNHENDGRQVAHNRRLLRLLGTPGADLFPTEIVWHDDFVQWPEVMSKVVDAELVASLGENSVAALLERARTECGHAPSLVKNTRIIESKLGLARDAGAQCATLDRLCNWILGAA